jgi:hypothetical protein
LFWYQAFCSKTADSSTKSRPPKGVLAGEFTSRELDSRFLISSVVIAGAGDVVGSMSKDFRVDEKK